MHSRIIKKTKEVIFHLQFAMYMHLSHIPSVTLVTSVKIMPLSQQLKDFNTIPHNVFGGSLYQKNSQKVMKCKTN